MESGPPGTRTTLIVSRGIGMERAAAPRLRFLCRPQIVVVELVPLKQIETTVSKRDDVRDGPIGNGGEPLDLSRRRIWHATCSRS
jgi:hypothetical protein